MKPVNLISIILIASLTAIQAQAHSDHSDTSSLGKPKLETLMRNTLAGVEGTEVIVSRVSLPPNSTLPKHWHPGEEFAYVLSGKVYVWQQNKADITVSAGEVGAIPLKQVHAASTREEGAVILVFRVHETGMPERTLVKQ